MAINFPNNRDQLDPPQPSGPLQDGDAFTDAGQTWTWNSGLGVWSTEPGGGADLDALYLSKINDDVANGAITFQGQTTHEVGVTIGTSSAGNINTGIFQFDGRGIALAHNSDNVFIGGHGLAQTAVIVKGTTAGGQGSGEQSVKQGLTVTSKFVGTMGNGSGIVSDCDVSSVAAGTYNFYNASISSGIPDAGKAFGVSRCYSATSNTAIGRNNSYGFYSDYAADDNKVYNFYAAGNAPNYFKGNLFVAFDADKIPGTNNTNAGTLIASGSTVGKVIVNMGGSNANVNHPIVARRTNTSSTANWQCILTGNHDNSADGYMTCGGATGRKIDVRLGATGVAMPGGAANIVKALQPKVITQGGETFNGFLPADLAGTFAAAVNGEAGATLAVGTYTDPDGNVETEVEEPEAIPFGATWVQTGTRDLMQGVSRGELIPLLTKALQETIAENESLKARLDALEANEVVDDATDSSLLTLVADLTTRVTALESP